MVMNMKVDSFVPKKLLVLVITKETVLEVEEDSEVAAEDVSVAVVVESVVDLVVIETIQNGIDVDHMEMINFILYLLNLSLCKGKMILFINVYFIIESY